MAIKAYKLLNIHSKLLYYTIDTTRVFLGNFTFIFNLMQLLNWYFNILKNINQTWVEKLVKIKNKVDVILLVHPLHGQKINK